MFADPGTPCCPRWSSNQGGRRTAATTWRIALTMTAHRHGSMLRWAVLAKIEPGVYDTHACDNRRAMRRLTTIVGPTASGKTTLAVELAEQIDGEIVGADSEAEEFVDPRNVRRVVRALEVYHATGKPFSHWRRKEPAGFESLAIGLRLGREELYRRIDQRVEGMFAGGLVDEVRGLLAEGY